MASETKIYRHTSDVHEESGAGMVAIVAIVLIVLVGVVLTVMFWEDIIGTTRVVETVVTDTEPAPATNTIIREEIRDSRSTNTVIVPASDPEAAGSSSSSSAPDSSGTTSGSTQSTQTQSTTTTTY